MNDILTPLEFMNLPDSNAKTTKAYLDLWEHSQKLARRLSDSEYARFKTEPYDMRWSRRYKYD